MTGAYYYYYIENNVVTKLLGYSHSLRSSNLNLDFRKIFKSRPSIELVLNQKLTESDWLNLKSVRKNISTYKRERNKLQTFSKDTFMQKEQKEAFEIVEKINESLFKKYGDGCPNLELVLGSYYYAVNLTNMEFLPDIILFSSLNDNRKYYEVTDSYENLEVYLKYQFEYIKERLNKISL